MARKPRPPAGGDLDPLVTILPEQSLLFRVHRDRLPANGFNPGHGGGGRFHFIEDQTGARVPSLYAAASPEAAIAETVFHDVPVRPSRPRLLAGALLGSEDLLFEGLRAVGFERRVRGWHLSRLRTTRELPLVELHDLGLKRLGLKASEITDTEASEYPHTRRWAQALHRATDAAGLVWMSRHYNSESALTLFGDRAAAGDLEVLGDPLDLGTWPGVELIYRIAEAAGVTVVHG